LLAALEPILEAAKRGEVTMAELDRAKARLELSTLQGLESVAGKAEQIGFYETVLGDPNELFHRLEAYRRVTLSDLLRVARRYLVSSARTRVEVLPDGAALDGDDDDDDSDDDGEEVAS